MDSKEFGEQVQGLWASRPCRPEDNTIAGVCSGIAARYRVDPTLVKVAFVVAAFFGGSGLVLYVAAWIAFPSARRARSEAGRSTPSGHGGSAHGLANPQVLLLVVLAIVVATSLGPNRTWGSGGLVGAVLMLAGWYLLYLRTPTPPQGTSVDSPSAVAVVVPPPASGQFERWIPRALMTPTPGSAHSPHASGTTPVTGHPATPTPHVDLTKTDPGGRRTDDADDETTDPALTGQGLADLDVPPPAWDPLGAARFAWDLPEPTSPDSTVQQRRRRSPLTLVVVGLALVVGAIGAALHQLGAGWFTLPHVLSMCLIVVGGGLLVASVIRRRTGQHSTGLVPIALGLGAAVIVTTIASGSSTFTAGLPSGGVGERMWKPLSDNDIDPEYSLTVGDATLDLREIELTADREVSVRNGLGNVTVLLPADMNVRVSCDTGVGNYSCPDGFDGGNDGDDGPVLSLEASTGAGEVEVTR